MNAGACVEAAAVTGTVMVRDSTRPADGQLRITAGAWQVFIARLKTG
jgi:hypothetical protein